MQLQLKTRVLDLGRPVVMGVLNVTPDSFSDGGRYTQLEAALVQARQMLAEGAAIIDVGGESTRPGAATVSTREELDRVLPVIERLQQETGCLISIDTMKPEVMDAACAAGADMINDVKALQAPGGIEVAKRHGVAVCLMHMQGEPRTMQQAPHYGDVLQEVFDFLAGRVEACVQAGIGRERLVADPGFGFGKTLEHNLQLLANLGRFMELGVPLLVGLSRKSMFGQLLDRPVDDRLAAGVAAAALVAWQGAHIVRTHDVRATMDTLRLTAAARKQRLPQK
jgi:dihydropteroate synthase